MIGIILLNDMYIRRRYVGYGYSDILYGPELHAYKFFQDACIMKSRLDKIGEYIDKARELFWRAIIHNRDFGDDIQQVFSV